MEYGNKENLNRGTNLTDRELFEMHQKMVEKQILRRGIQDKKVISAMRKVPRHEFVPENFISEAYDDNPLPIGEKQTISQPYIVAFMTEKLELSPEDTVLEIGTGSGYQAAILAEIASHVYSIEIVPSLGVLSQPRRRGSFLYRPAAGH